MWDLVLDSAVQQTKLDEAEEDAVEMVRQPVELVHAVKRRRVRGGPYGQACMETRYQDVPGLGQRFTL